MMGKSYRGESLFYTFRLDDYIPKNHLLRVIHEYVDLSFVRKRLASSYSHTGRPSIDPEVLLRILLIGYFYGITSERRLVEEIGMHLAYRWFTGLDFNQTIPDHSTFSKNRHMRFKESGIFGISSMKSSRGVSRKAWWMVERCPWMERGSWLTQVPIAVSHAINL